MAGNAAIENITFHKDTAAVSDGKIYTVSSNASTLNIDFMATEGTTFVANFEGKVAEESDWDSISCVNLKSLTLSNTATTTDTYQIDLTAWSYIKIRVSSISGGTLTALGKAVG